jgi:hypothetical protein
LRALPRNPHPWHSYSAGTSSYKRNACLLKNILYKQQQFLKKSKFWRRGRSIVDFFLIIKAMHIKHINKWRAIPCSRIGWLNIVKIVVLQLINRIKTISSGFIFCLFLEIEADPKIYTEMQIIWKSLNNF